jgi:Family of unknown function (DUF6152)
MKGHFKSLGFGLCLSLLLSAPLWAHHSFAAEFDGSRSVAVTGVLTKVDWTNPHIEFSVDVNQDGNATTWTCAALGPGVLRHAGVNRDDLKIGEKVTVRGYPAKNGGNHMYARVVEFSDGHKIMTGLNVTGADQ